ncbi:MAG: ATP-dependent helicase [Desulfobacterales bacterium]|nr:ATP-dependent helicase [Desulfobacterales bacterium]
MDKQIDIFQKLRRTQAIITKPQNFSTIYFQLNFDQGGAYLKIVDEKGKEVTPDYEYYSGQTRYILKSMDKINEKKSFRINWETPNDPVYLFENEYLIWQLKQCNNFVDENFKPIHFVDEMAKLILKFEERKGGFSTKLVLLHDGNIFENLKLLNENHVFAHNSIFQVPPISENFRLVSLFETIVLPSNLEKFFTLFFSYLRNINIDFQDYQKVQGEQKITNPVLIFEKVDINQSLYIRISSSLIGFDPDFTANYDITRIGILNGLEKKIIVSDLIYEDISPLLNEMDKLLKKYRKDLKDKNNYYLEDTLFIIEENLAKLFIQSELPNLIMKYPILGSEKLKNYNIKAVRPKLNLRLSHGIDFLEGDASLDIDGEQISIFDALNQYKKNAYILLSDGTQAIIDKSYMNKLNRIFKKQKDKVKLSFFDLPIVEEIIEEKISMDALKKSREIFLGFNTLHKTKVAIPKINTKLRGYQEQGYKWLNYIHQHELGGCLADDMGLGKTVQAITLLASIYPQQKLSSLIVMPKSLLFNWEQEIQKFKPELSYYIYHGSSRNLSDAKKKNLILTTYATVRNDIKEFQKIKFYYIILDESQNIKNLSSQISKAVMLLNGKNRLGLSGTPIENNLSELYSLFRFLNPSMFGTIEDFNQNYANPIQKGEDKEALIELKKKIYPFILRRLKKEVLKDLPDKIEQTLYIDMSPEQEVFYEQRRAYYYETVKTQIALNGIQKSQFVILQALSELRQIASIPESKTENTIISPKREVLLDNIIDVVANNHKVLVFANFLNALDCISEDLEKNNIDYLLMTGATRDRKQLVEKFQNDDTYKVFLMTLKTGGIGLNLTAADYIFIFDPWWNKSAENQAIDRTHRIGQDKTVFSYKLITRKTIEEKILKLQQVKSELFESLISSDGASIKALDEKDVEFVLGL